MIVLRDHGLAAGAGRVFGAAADRRGHAVVPPERARVLPDGAPLIARINAFLQEHITGMSTVQLFRREARSFAPVRRHQPPHRDANVESIFYYAVFYPAIEIIGALAAALIIWFGGGWTSQGTLTLGSLVAFLPVRPAVLPADQRHVGEVQRPPGRDGLVRAHLQAARHAGEDWRGRSRPEAPAKPRPSPAPASRGLRHDRLRGRVVRLQRDRATSCATSRSRWPGERVGIVGATGAGKSTLINLLLRFYDVHERPDPGRRRRHPPDDLQPLRGCSASSCRTCTCSPARSRRTSGSGPAAITDEQVRAAARAVHADRFIIASCQAGYDEPVAERGATLSVGQKQLLSFARALAFDPEILVLDEATSSVDTETELIIRDALKVLMAGRTTLAIAHRLSTIQDMDKILVMHHGELREPGRTRSCSREAGSTTSSISSSSRTRSR